jgi:hypothetical protein
MGMPVAVLHAAMMVTMDMRQIGGYQEIQIAREAFDGVVVDQAVIYAKD